MNEKSRPKKDKGLEIDEVFKKLRVVTSQCSTESKAIDELQLRLGEILPYISGGGGGIHLVEGLKNQINLVEHLKHQGLQALGEFKSETFTFLGIPFVDEVERRSEYKHSNKGKPFTDSRLKKASSSGMEERGRGLQTEMEKDKKISELTDLLEVYAAIVSRHDSEEKKRIEEENSLLQPNTSSPGSTIDELMKAADKLKSENKRLESHIQALKEESDQMRKAKEYAERKAKEIEFMLLRASQWHRAVAQEFPSSGVDVGCVRGSIRESLSHNSVPPERVRAKIVSPESWIGESNRGDTNRALSNMDSSRFRGAPRSMNPLFSELRTLSPISMSNPTPQERRLLHRIGLYESKLAELEQYEIDRKRCFDEMEKTRAELFTSMNSELERRKYTIHSLSLERDSLQQAVSMSRQSSIIGVTERNRETSLAPPLMQRGLKTMVDRAVSPIAGDDYESSTSSSLLVFYTLVQEESDSRLVLESEAFQSFCDYLVSFIQLKTMKITCGNAHTRPTIAEQSDDNSMELTNAVLSEKINCSTDAVLTLYGECLDSVRKILSSGTYPEVDDSLEEESDIHFAVNAIRRLNSGREGTFSIHERQLS